MPKLREIVRTIVRAAPRAQLASAIAVRERAAGGAEFLLVRTSNGERWTFPKGHRDRGESLAEAAAREAVEEAGVSGRLDPIPLAQYRYPSARDGGDLVTAYLLRVEEEGLPAEARRDPSWFGFEAARSKLAAGRAGGFGEEMERLLLAAQRRSRGEGSDVPRE